MRLSLLAGISLIGLTPFTAARADTLQEALLLAYENNPTLAGARAGLRVIDENVPLAKADGLPSVSVDGNYTENILTSQNSFISPDRTLTFGPQLTIPIYQGGGVRNAINAAEKRVEAGQASLRGSESSVFSKAVAAYLDVLRDQAIVALNRNSVEVLQANRKATDRRYSVGDVTKTDLAQSESRLASSVAQLQSAEARLITSRERYIEVIGKAPEDLQPPPPLTDLPSTAEEAVATALTENPDIEAARIAVDAFRYDTQSAESSRLPSVSVTARTTYNDNFGTLGGDRPIPNLVQREQTASAGISFRVPLFSGGRPAARVRQAQARTSQAMEQLVATERSVVQQTRSAFASWQASLRVIQSAQTAVEAAQRGLDGVRIENKVGTRTILDVLNAEQELLNTRVSLIGARRDAYVASFTLLAAMGRAEAEDLGLEGGVLYDPQVNYDRVRNNIWDWGKDPDPIAQSTSTAEVPAQDARLSENILAEPSETESDKEN